MGMTKITPILASSDESRAKEFYVDFLGFKLLFEHRFETGKPLYMAVKRDYCELHISEHTNYVTPISSVRIELDDLEGYHEELVSRSFDSRRPTIEKMPWANDMEIKDPFGNILIFTDAISS